MFECKRQIEVVQPKGCYRFVDQRTVRSTSSVSCSMEGKDATQQAPRHPPAPLEEATETLAGKDTSDDGRVVRGDSRPRNDGTGGRFYFNLTGFPFPLGPLFARQTVRTEVSSRKLLAAMYLPASGCESVVLSQHATAFCSCE